LWVKGRWENMGTSSSGLKRGRWMEKIESWIQKEVEEHCGHLIRIRDNAKVLAGKIRELPEGKAVVIELPKEVAPRGEFLIKDFRWENVYLDFTEDIAPRGTYLVRKVRVSKGFLGFEFQGEGWEERAGKFNEEDELLGVIFETKTRPSDTMFEVVMRTVLRNLDRLTMRIDKRF
jgi:hypothetical protein